MEAVSFSEKLVNFYQTTWPHIPEYGILQNINIPRKLPIQDSRFSQQDCWRFKSSGMLHHFNRQTDANFSMDCSTLKMSVTIYQRTQCTTPEDLNLILLRACSQSCQTPPVDLQQAQWNHLCMVSGSMMKSFLWNWCTFCGRQKLTSIHLLTRTCTIPVEIRSSYTAFKLRANVLRCKIRSNGVSASSAFSRSGLHNHTMQV